MKATKLVDAVAQGHRQHLCAAQLAIQEDFRPLQHPCTCVAQLVAAASAKRNHLRDIYRWLNPARDVRRRDAAEDCSKPQFLQCDSTTAGQQLTGMFVRYRVGDKLAHSILMFDAKAEVVSEVAEALQDQPPKTRVLMDMASLIPDVCSHTY